MNPRILKKPQVEFDLIDHYSFIARDKQEPADRFLRAAAETFALLAANPLAGQTWSSPHPELVDVRVFSMPKAFRNYLVFYRPIDAGVEILTVVHGSRDLAMIVERLSNE
jgi:toxin ParE1/3/4